MLRKNNIEIRNKSNKPHIDVNDWCELYESGWTLEQIAKRYNYSIQGILNHLNSCSVKIRTRNEHYNPNFNERYFEEIDTEDKAYFLGFLITDGCISEPDIKNNKTNHTIRLSLASQDLHILEFFKQCIGLSARVLTNNRNESTLSIHSDKMAKDLEKYGVVPRKSLITYLPLLSEELMPHLLRGIFDGNGWITNVGKKNVSIGLCGASILVEQVNAFWAKQLNIAKAKVIVRFKEGISKVPLYQCCWCGTNRVKTICDYLYNNANFYLDRKHSKYLNMTTPW